MKSQNAITKSYLLKTLAWFGIIGALSGLCVWHHFSTGGLYSSTYSVAFVILLTAVSFYLLKLHLFFFSRRISGVITEVKVRSIQQDPEALQRRIDLYNFADLYIECDNGRRDLIEQRLPNETSAYKVGDRVLKLRGAAYTCRFPQKEDGTYAQYSAICPICGAVVTEPEIDTCPYCKRALPEYRKEKK